MKETIFVILIFYFLYIFTKLLVSFSQIAFIRGFKTKNDGFDEKELNGAKEYALAKERFIVVESLYDAALFCFWAFFGFFALSPLLSSDSLWTQTLGVLTFLALGFVLELPIKAALTFGLDKKFGFTSTTVSLFAIDKTKELLITVVVGGALSIAAIYFVSSFEYWSVSLFLLLASFMISANILYPNFIAPMFNKFEKLQNEEITAGLKELAAKSGFDLQEIYRVDAGKRDTRLNAYFAGMGKTKRVALYDTLLAKLSKEELFAVVAHELGHFKHKHLIGSMGSMLVVFFCLTSAFGALAPEFYEALSLPHNGAGVVVAFLVFSTPAVYFAMPIINYIYKKNEFEADAYAASMSLKEPMIAALKTLSKENKAFPYASKAKIFFDYSHPPITQRIAALEA